MAERLATFRPHVGTKSVPQELGAGSMLHGCEPNCPAFLLNVFKLFSCVVVWPMVLMVQGNIASSVRQLHGAVEGGALGAHHVIGPRSESPVSETKLCEVN